MTAGKKRMLTGLQPTGSLHLGNYFGALRPFVELYEKYESYLMVVDYHALTTIRDPETLKRQTIDVVKDYLAVGVDPEKATLFKQSDVPEHTELAWIFECLVTVPFLQQAHAYKDKVAKGLEATVGLFNYPMLMAADILLYDAEVIPVGEDQKQHIEYAREVVGKFNNAYGDTFVEPGELIYQNSRTVPGIDGQKMSKSYGNTIPLFGSKEAVQKAVMSIVTDSEGDVPQNVYAIHSLFKDANELDPLYNEKKGNYKELKEALLEDIERLIEPMREKRNAISDADVAAVLKNGAEKAREKAVTKMDAVRRKIGVSW